MDWLQILTIVIGSTVVSTLMHIWYSSYQTEQKAEAERYRKLYGPLKFHLLMMKHMVENKEEVLEEIKKWGSAEMQVNLMQKHLSPLTKKWLGLRDQIKALLEENPGLIKKEDFTLMSDFVDGCVKREIIEEGQNVLAVNENMTNKLLAAVKNMQDRFL